MRKLLAVAMLLSGSPSCSNAQIDQFYFKRSTELMLQWKICVTRFASAAAIKSSDSTETIIRGAFSYCRDLETDWMDATAKTLGWPMQKVISELHPFLKRVTEDTATRCYFVRPISPLTKMAG